MLYNHCEGRESGGRRKAHSRFALRLTADGYDIALCYRSADAEALELRGLIEARGRQCMSVKCDVADHLSVQAFALDVEDRLGAPDVVVNSAGITRDRALFQMSAEDFCNVMDVNLGGTFNICRAFAFGMVKGRIGSIVNISSVSGVFGNRGQTNYSASKAGIIGFSLALSKELGSAGIRVNVVAPGFIDTDMTSGLGDAVRADVLKRIPLKCFGTPDDVANAVAFLVSSDARYVTGQVIRIDGGLVL